MHEADEAGGGQESHGAAGSGQRSSGVQDAKRGDGGDDGGAPGQSARTADRERGAETAPPCRQAAAHQLAG